MNAGFSPAIPRDKGEYRLLVSDKAPSFVAAASPYVNYGSRALRCNLYFWLEEEGVLVELYLSKVSNGSARYWKARLDLASPCCWANHLVANGSDGGSFPQAAAGAVVCARCGGESSNLALGRHMAVLKSRGYVLEEASMGTEGELSAFLEAFFSRLVVEDWGGILKATSYARQMESLVYSIVGRENIEEFPQNR